MGQQIGDDQVQQVQSISRPRVKATGAIMVSATPMGWPVRSSSPAMRPASSAVFVRAAQADDSGIGVGART